MDRLEKILAELMGVEYEVNALCVVLSALEKRFEIEGTEELKAVICLCKRLTETYSEQLANSITDLDRYLLDSK